MNIKKNGFTFVELIIAIAVAAVIMTAIYASVNMAQRSSASVGRKVVTQQDARAVLDLMAMEIRMASYNPTISQTTWIGNVLGNCSGSSISLTQTNKGIQFAGANEIRIAMDLDNSGTIGNADNEYIVYKYNGSDTITRNVSCGGNQAFLGGAGSATTVSNNTGTFQYFDRDGSVAAVIPNIRRVRITIVADTENPDSLTHQPRRMTYTTDVLVKNHVLCP